MNDGVLTERERYNQVIDAWTNARVAVTNEMIRGLKEDTKEDGTPYLNPIYLMTRFRGPRQHRPDSAARRHASLDGQAQRRDHRDARSSRTSARA